MSNILNKYSFAIKNTKTLKANGKISQVVGLLIEAKGPSAAIGEICNIALNGIFVGRAEVVGFKEDKTLLMPIGDMTGIRPGLDIISTGHPLRIKVSESLLGRVLNGIGEPIDDKGPLGYFETKDITCLPPSPLLRKRINQTMPTGIRSIDAFSTLGKGQRVGIFAGSGVGKSVTLGMIARNCEADINVIALIGERGREVKEFIERDLGKEGLKKSVVIVATSDQPALIRLKGALTATTIAEYFREKGSDVMLLFDSATRVAMAQREIGLATGEPPASKGYTPSVFAFLPKLMERAGTSENGSITGMYTVLVEGDDMDEPIADAMRSILDGHIVLDRNLANRNHYPAVDILGSISRVMNDVISEDQKNISKKLLSLIAQYRNAEDLINIGAYSKGSNSEVDKAISIMNDINSFLKQGINEKENFDNMLNKLKVISGKVK